MLEFCPSCFALHEQLSVLNKANKYKCSKCACVFPLNATMISEDTVRTYIAQNPRKLKQLLYNLERIIKDEN